jgi:hypothetical protein
MSKLLGEQIEVSGSEHGVASSYFEVHGRLRMGPTVVRALAGAPHGPGGHHRLA